MQSYRDPEYDPIRHHLWESLVPLPQGRRPEQAQMNLAAIILLTLAAGAGTRLFLQASRRKEKPAPPKKLDLSKLYA